MLVSQPRARHDALFCAFFVGLCAMLTYPASAEGYLDDFSYIKTALDFAQTGHIVYNGWATAMLGWQILWGALFIKLFGLSFTVLRFSTLLLAMGSVYLFHRILTALGISPRNAAVGTLSLALSPLFLPVALSFMTDVPGLFVILLCMYASVRAVAAVDDRATVQWLLGGAIISLVGGTVRQTSWLGVLVIVPSAAWMLRTRRHVLLTGFLSAGLSLPAILAMMHWFSRQPNVMPEPTLQLSWFRGVVANHLIPTVLKRLWIELAKACLLVLFLLMPFFVAWLPTLRQMSRRTITHIVLGVGFVAVLIRYASHKDKFYFFLAPSLYFANVPITGPVPIDQLTYNNSFIPNPVRIAITFFLFASIVVMLESLRLGRRFEAKSDSNIPSAWQQFFWIFVPFSLVYMLLVVPRAAIWELFGRYMLGIMPTGIVFLLLLYQRRVRGRLPWISVAAMAAIALFAMADRHDFFSRQRASDTALSELLQADIPRTSISKSFNSDGWIQLLIDGRLNLQGSPSPSVANKPVSQQFVPAPACSTWFEPLAPTLNMKFFIIGSPSSCLVPTNFRTLNYRTLLPPYHREIMIEERIEIPDTLH